MIWFIWTLEKKPHIRGARGGTIPSYTLLSLPSPHCIMYLRYYLLQLAVTVDEVYGEQGSSAGAFTSLSLGYVYLGGSENTVALPGTKASSNFVGCIRKVNKWKNKTKQIYIIMGLMDTFRIAIIWDWISKLGRFLFRLFVCFFRSFFF